MPAPPRATATIRQRSERGLAPRSIVRHLPVIRRFLHEVCSGGATALCKISQEDVIKRIMLKDTVDGEFREITDVLYVIQVKAGGLMAYDAKRTGFPQQTERYSG